MKKYFMMFCIILSFQGVVFSTFQTPDIILYDNNIFELFSNPLKSFYNENNPVPDFRIKQNGLPNGSGNWRGYVAIWEIEENILYLRGIESWIGIGKQVFCVPPSSLKKADLKELFGDKCQNGKVKASWFTGELRIPKGKMLKYAHMGYASVYENDIILTIESGEVKVKKVIDNTKKEIPSSMELEGLELEKMQKNKIKY